jgi:hypothetical protein
MGCVDGTFSREPGSDRWSYRDDEDVAGRLDHELAADEHDREHEVR